MNNQIRIYGAALAASILLSACGDGSKGSATPRAAEEFAEIAQIKLDESDAADKEWKEVIEHFEKHMDTRYASSESRYTMLHLAAMFNKAELVRCLLLDGADPNATTRYPATDGGTEPGEDTALEMALIDIAQTPAGAAGIIATIDALLQGGAKAEVKGTHKGDLASTAISLCEYEEAVLYLLQQTPQAKLKGYDAHILAGWKGWAQVLQHLIRQKAMTPEAASEALYMTACGAFNNKGHHNTCAQQLLQQGADINTRQKDESTPLFAAAALLQQTESQEASHVIDLVELLLQQGADASLTGKDEEYPGCCAWDLLRMHPSALDELKKRGIQLQDPPITFSAGVSLLSDVCKAKMRGMKADDVQPHFKRIAAILTPTEDMSQNHIYPEALENAIALLCAADAAQASAAVAAMPLWNDIKPWQQESHQTQALLSAIRNNHELILPPELLLGTANKLIEAGQTDAAASLVEWIGRSPQTEPQLQQLTQSPHPAIRAGAWSAILLQKELPLPRDGEIRYWMEQHPEANKETPELQKALLLTSLEELWYGNMPKNKQKQLIEAMRDIGAAKAAAQYDKIAQNLLNPDVLDEIMSQPDDWKFELEIATAQFILKNEQVFRLPRSENTD